MDEPALPGLAAGRSSDLGGVLPCVRELLLRALQALGLLTEQPVDGAGQEDAVYWVDCHSGPLMF